MKDLQLQLFQLDEACRYLKDGRIPHLRLALTLLDNSIELQLDKKLASEFAHEETQERLRKHVLRIPEKERTPDLQKLIEWEPLSFKEKNQALRLFDEKINLTAARYKLMIPSIAEVVQYLHKYRNDAFHRIHIRKDTIITSVVILLDIACDLLLNIKTYNFVHSSDEDYSWLEQRFGVKSSQAMLDETFTENAIRLIKEDVSITDDSIKLTLAENLLSRSSETRHFMDFILENSRAKTRDQVLKNAYQFAKNNPQLGERPFKGKHDSFALKFLEELEKDAGEIANAQDRVIAFNKFAAIEAKFEPVESAIAEITSIIDYQIQLEVDIARGK